MLVAYSEARTVGLSLQPASAHAFTLPTTLSPQYAFTESIASTGERPTAETSVVGPAVGQPESGHMRRNPLPALLSIQYRREPSIASDLADCATNVIAAQRPETHDAPRQLRPHQPQL